MQHVILVKNELKKLLVTLRNDSSVKSRHMSLTCTHIEDAVFRLDACEREGGREVKAGFEPADLLDPIAVEPAKHPVPASPSLNKTAERVAVMTERVASVARAPRPPVEEAPNPTPAPPNAPSRTIVAEDPTNG